MPTKTRPALSWLDRLLIKLAVAKAGARNTCHEGLAHCLAGEFRQVNGEVSETVRDSTKNDAR